MYLPVLRDIMLIYLSCLQSVFWPSSLSWTIYYQEGIINLESFPKEWKHVTVPRYSITALTNEAVNLCELEERWWFDRFILAHKIWLPATPHSRTRFWSIKWIYTLEHGSRNKQTKAWTIQELLHNATIVRDGQGERKLHHLHFAVGLVGLFPCQTVCLSSRIIKGGKYSRTPFPVSWKERPPDFFAAACSKPPLSHELTWKNSWLSIRCILGKWNVDISVSGRKKGNESCKLSFLCFFLSAGGNLKYISNMGFWSRW